MSWRRYLSALLAVALALCLPLASLAEAIDAGDEPPFEEEVVSEPVEALEEVEIDGGVDPWAEPAQDAGDTGLVVEIEEAEAWEDAEPDEIDLPAPEPEEWTESAEALWEGENFSEAPEEGEVLAEETARVGYVAVAMEAAVYGDAALRIRFDTDDARSWAAEIPTGYVLTEETLALTDEETAALTAALTDDARTRWIGDVPAPWAAFSALDGAVSAEGETAGLNVAYRTQADIQAYADAHPSYRYQANLYSVAPEDDPYTVGYLSPVNQQSALNIVNQARYIAGLDEISLYGDMEYMVAAASLVLRLYGRLSHYPSPRPDALSDGSYDALYSAGYTGAGRSNIAMGYTVTSAILAYMADADDTNREHLGHRRWILNPAMGRTIFGANGRFSAMYAHDRSAAGGQTRVAWPAQEMPVQYFSAGDPWSLSYGKALNASQIEVDLVRQGDGRSWHFSQSASDGYFNVDNAVYGQAGCVIFQPAGLESISVGDAFNVSVTDGASGEVTRYTVRFFDLNRSAAEPLSRLNVSAVKEDGGVRVSWSTDGRATGYYVCRLNKDNVYQIIADVTGGDSYLDTAVAIASGVNYQYRVYAHTASLTSSAASDVKSARAADGVTLNASGTVTLYTNATLQLKGTLVPTYADSGLTWTTSNKKAATVDENGLVKPVKAGGTATITVATDDGKKARVKVKVAAPPKPTKVTLDRKGTVKLNLGEKLTLTATLKPAHAESALIWSSSNAKIAKVSRKGVVTPVKAGTATITVKTANGKKASVKVTVVDPRIPTRVKLDASGTVKLYAGDQLPLTATISPTTAAKAKLTWTSSDKRIAKVSSRGVVTALKKGTVTITVRTSNGKTASVKIRVIG